MKLLLTVFTFILFANSVQSQSINLRGKLIDTVGKQSLLNASISLLDKTDSTLEQFTLAKESGSFEMKNLSVGTYLLQITFQGFEPIYKKITLSKEETDKNLGSIYLKQAFKDLGTVVVTQSPVVIKTDTVEYNAGSFKTKPNAMVEDLLKKMPGIQVDKSGGIKAQGEDVQRVLVDGKRFFGDDPKMATKNLPSDVIDKIQVFDALSDQSAFSGFDDGNRTKTINIITKKDKRKGTFGKMTAGMGSDGDQLLNDHNISLSNFNDGRQLTFTGQGNNVNKQGFSTQDFLGTLGGGGGGRQGGGGGVMNIIQNIAGSSSTGGIINTWSGGLNYSDKWGARTEVSGSGFYNNQKTNNIQNSFTENFTSGKVDSSIFSTQNKSTFNNNSNGRFNFNIEKQLDSLGNNSLIIRPNINLQKTNRTTTTNTGSTKGKFVNLNNSVARTGSDNEGYNGNVDLTFRHRFKKKGRSFTVSGNVGRNDNDGTGNNYSVNEYYNNNVSFRKDTIDQNYNSFNTTKSLNGTFSYSEPLGKFSQIEIAYNHSYQEVLSDKHTFSFDKGLNNYSIPVANLTNDFSNTYISDRGTLSYRITKPKYNFTIGNGVQWGNLKSINNSLNNTIEQNYINLFPTARFNYSFSKTENLRFNYSGRTSQPSVSQLQPIVDNSDPLNIRVGNAALQQKFSHNFRTFYNSFNILTQKIIFAMVNVTFVANDIQNSVLISNRGVQTTMPVNLDGTYSIIGYFNYGFPLRKPKSNLNLGVNYSRLQSQGLINNESNYSRNTTIGTNILWTTNLKDKWDINFTSNSMYNIARYTLQPNQNADFFSQFLSVEATHYTKSGWIFSTDLDYTYNGGRTDGFNTSIPLLNASIAKQLFKDKAGEVKVFMFDLFNQNQSVSRTVSSNSIQDMQSLVLTNYFMVSFTYNLRNFKAQGNQPRMMQMFKMGEGGGRSGGMNRGG